MDDFIQVYDDALPRDFCQKAIREFEARKSMQYAGRTGGGVDEVKKKSTDINLNRNQAFHPLLNDLLIHARPYFEDYFQKFYFLLIGSLGLTVKHPNTGEAVALNHDNFEEVGRPQVGVLMQQLFRIGEVNLQKYQQNSGGYPHWHSEIFPTHNGDALHRALLFMFYLNDVEDGGETDFFYQQQSIKPKAGRMVIAPAGFTHTHRGQIPKSGDKYIATSWVLFQHAEALYGKPG